MAEFPDLEKMRDAIDTEIRGGKVGCNFGTQAARKGHILYAGIREADHADDVAGAVKAFRNNTSKRVLYLIPQTQPATHAEGARVAWKLYADVLRCLFNNRREVPSLSIFTLESILHLKCFTREHLEALLGSEAYQAYVQKQTVYDVTFRLIPATLDPCDDPTPNDEHQLLTFALGPYYTSVTGHPHPRYAPYSGMFLNYSDDFASLPEESMRMARQRAEAAMGYSYIQSLHPDLRPEPAGRRDGTELNIWLMKTPVMHELFYFDSRTKRIRMQLQMDS